MKWIKVTDSVPKFNDVVFTARKVNKKDDDYFFEKGYLSQKIETQKGITYLWICGADYTECSVDFWMEIEQPNNKQ